ncbi:ABC transporter substrate-binding protein, partial [Aquamicrobium sp.]|uniref:ABC transporter substrate-binding protein n=1 Tax=Aquamicrobium sp. TaxID=1872579 RepID=UPI0025896EF6
CRYGAVVAPERDIEQAKKLLAEAGYPDGIDVELYLKSAPSWESKIVQSMLGQWAEAGIRVTMRPVPPAQYWEIWQKVPLGFTDWNHRPLGIMLYDLVLRTGGEWNESAYSNPDFDKLLDEAGATVELDERKKIMSKLEEILIEDGPLVQPVYRNVYTAYNKKLKNFSMHPSNYNYYKDMWIEE